MKKTALFFLMIATSVLLNAQHETPASEIYRATPEKINNLVHTKLDVILDFPNSYIHGKAWITLQPHFYPTDSLALDAKGMEIKKVELATGSKKQALKYGYDGLVLNINLGKTFTRNDRYTIYIEYTGKPDEFEAKGSAAITDAKGLYFINPKGEDKNKPVQVWTQGETEGSSVWFPTIDKPNQKTTQEIAITIPDKFVSLSNGALISQKKNKDGTRTDTYKLDQPHAPYLFFIGAGDFAVVKDSYKGKEVSYYVEKEYETVARQIFGMTPEMLGFFSKILDYEYPWNKYAQMTARDYVSGAMENTTAVLHQEGAQQDARELLDRNHWEGVIAHEAFHHWFGNLVTTESWSNLAMNEAFANYSEYLWYEYKYGKEEADKNGYNEMMGYINSESEEKHLVRFFYDDKEDMFDAVSYNKGGRVLHMLRNVLGDSAFFRTLNLYLKQNAYKAAEAHHLRLAAEEVSGKDLNWFFNQWFFGNGHLNLNINYSYNEQNKKAHVIVKQQQDGALFEMPVAIDIYEGDKKYRHQVWLKNAIDTFTFTYTQKPDLINFDGNKYLLAEKKENKTLENYIFQYKNAGNYLDKREAVVFAGEKYASPEAVELLRLALKDSFYSIRSLAISRISPSNAALKQALEKEIVEIAENDPKRITKAAAIELLGSFQKEAYTSIFEKALQDSSYSIAGAALMALSFFNEELALKKAVELDNGKIKGSLLEAVTTQYITSGREEYFDRVAETFNKLPLSETKFNLLMPIGDLIIETESTSLVQKAVGLIVNFRDEIPEGFGLTEPLNAFLNGIAERKTVQLQTSNDKNAIQQQIDYIKEQASGRKGF